MTNTYLSICQKIFNFLARSKEHKCEIIEDFTNKQLLTLWDMATPEETASSIKKFYTKPMEECLRRQSVTLETKHDENIRFWDNVRQILS